MFKIVRRAAAAALALLCAPVLTLAGAPAAFAQDAFNCVGKDEIIQGVNTDYRHYIEGTNTSGDAFDSQVGMQVAPQLQGATNGTMRPVDEDDYRRESRMPNGRVMLGESLCDLTTREIAADDEAPPPDFPPMPKRISIPKVVTELKAKEKLARDNYDNERPIKGPENYWDRENYSNVGDDRVFSLRGTSKYVSRNTIHEASKVNLDASNNPDFTAHLAAMSLKMQNEARPKNFFEQTAEIVGKVTRTEPDDYTKMIEFKKSLTKIKESNATPVERAQLADKLEKSGRYYDALVERLRCVDLLDDGPSRFYLARVYTYMGEKKLAFETLKDAVEQSWSPSDRDLLIECHILLGDYLFDSAKEALRSGNAELNILRLRNASVSYRRAATMDRGNKKATWGLIKVAREAVSVDPSFDNYLLLGGAYLIAGDLDKAQVAYDECAELSPDNAQLKQARMIYQLAVRRRDQSPRAEAVVTARRRQSNADGDTLVSERKQR
jgi:tetratricopeptide (TPR) repeat protein